MVRGIFSLYMQKLLHFFLFVKYLWNLEEKISAFNLWKFFAGLQNSRIIKNSFMGRSMD